MVNFYNDVMALRASKDEIDRSIEYLTGHGFKVEEPRNGVPSVREQAFALRELIPEYRDNWFVRGTKHGDVSDRVEEALACRNWHLRFNRKKRDAYNEYLRLMAQVAPSASDSTLRARPIWKPSIKVIPGIGIGCVVYLTSKLIGYGLLEKQDSLSPLEMDNLPYTLGGIAFGMLMTQLIDKLSVSTSKKGIIRETRNLVNALRETPERIGLQREVGEQ